MREIDHVAQILEQWRHERPDLDSSVVGVIGRLHRLADRLRVELISLYNEFGLGEGEFDLLATLRRQGEPFALTPTQIAERTMVTSGAVSKRVDRLEEAGLVRRSQHPQDGRGRSVTLTASGRELIDEAYTAHVANEHRLLAGLSQDERNLLVRLLTKWSRSLDMPDALERE